MPHTIPLNNSVPSRIDRIWFRHRYGQHFPDLLKDEYNTLLDNVIQDVYAMFKGVGEMWEHLDSTSYFEKTRMCYGLLVAWYLADMYPDFSEGVVSMGSGIPLKSKKIGNTEIRFAELSSKAGGKNANDMLSLLKSNQFGVKAYLMIKSSGKVNVFLTR